MITIGFSISLMIVAFLVTMLVYPNVLTFAKKHNILDNPNARKLQRVPVPVMGGTTVFIGMLVAFVLGYLIIPEYRVLPIALLLFVMYLIGVWDDVKEVSAAFRFLVELIVVWLMIVLLHVEINDFHSLWGIYEIPDLLSVPLSLIAGVGIINAINMIDGVDGYCSTYGIMTCAAFAVIFFHAGDMAMFTIALIVIGSLIPFFFHNVFGKTSKMFLGDGGSLMLGTILALFMFSTLTKESLCSAYGVSGLSLPALVLAILAVPVFDTLKVMIVRVIKGQSPFHPDKTHLHHLFIDLNFSHLATSGIIVFLNIVIIGVLIMCWCLGVGTEMQLYIVICLSFIFTWGFYFFMEREHRKNDGEGSRLFQSWCKHGLKTNISSTPFWQFVRRIVDCSILGGMKSETKEGTETSYKQIDPRI